MSEFISKAKEQLLIYWGVAFYVFLFSGVSFAGAWMTATAGVDYSTLGFDAKMRVWIGCFSVWGTTMMAFMNKALAKISGNQVSLDDLGQTTRTTRIQSQVVETTQTPPPSEAQPPTKV